MIKPIKRLLEPNVLFWLVLSYTLLVTILFLLPKIDISIAESNFPIDKIGHTGIHLLLALGWLSYFFIKENKKLSTGKIGKILIICFLYGIIIEIIQQVAIPLRQADIIDVLANTIGLFLGYKVFWNFKKRLIV
jgi:VanZ family protein